MLDTSNQLLKIKTQLNSLEINLKNITNPKLNMLGMPNISSEIQNIGIQILSMGIQIITKGIEMPDFGNQMPNTYNQIINIDMQLQNIGNKIIMKNNNMMPCMDMIMPNFGIFAQNMMMNNNNIVNDMNQMYPGIWNLIFEDRCSFRKIVVHISPEKTVQEAINLYKIKSGNDSSNCKFIYNGRQLKKKKKIQSSGLQDNSVIGLYKP